MKYRRKQAARGASPQETHVQHSPGGLKGRWMINSLSFVVCILAAVIIFVSMGISSYYYSNLRGNLVTRASETASVFKKYWTDSEEQFISMADQHVADFKEKDKLELQFIDRYGRVFCSSSGLATDSIPGTSDVQHAMEDKQISVYTGEDPQTDERVMSVSAPLTTSHGDMVGAVRYITSLALAERQIALVILISIAGSLVFLVLVVLSNRYFIKSILEPVMRINVIAKEIAAGRYGMRLHKAYDDEIGELCDTINYMSDEISRAEHMKNDFISSVSHELRTPLTAIAGWSETLIAGGAQDTEETMQGLEIIQKESRRLTQMVEELLDFSRMESGRMKLEVESFDVSTELYEALYMYENLLEDAGIRVHYQKQEGNYFISGDRHRIKQVFLNILDNAAKYGKSGGRIEVSLLREGGNIVACVRDWGVGIPEAELPFVKEKFYKGSSKQRGSGIGLAVTDEIVTLHGGSLEIRSRAGEGTAVYIILPALEAHTAMGVEGITEPTEETEE
ncbi:MAG: ATP-binding protein [Intestinibacillus sp.]